MKRTPMKRKTELKRTGFKSTGKRKSSRQRKKRTPYAIAKDKAWNAFSRYTRLRDALRTTGTADKCECVTCGKIVDTFSSSCHAGHWLGGRKGKNLFEEHACHGQCSGCNIWGSGNQTKYEQFMVETYGHEEMDRIVLQANSPHTYSVDDLKAIRAKYERKAEDLA